VHVRWRNYSAVAADFGNLGNGYSGLRRAYLRQAALGEKTKLDANWPADRRVLEENREARS
jgi:hypothetical protein